ncbi:MAG: GTP-binding protein [Candidatus Lokiarchaeota archaeon]|nr:GTP-binding protein [Candidatus Lokiarchaeota archaeon]
MVDTKKLSELLDWYFKVVDSLVSVVIADRDGLLFAAKDKSGSIELDSEKVGGLSALVEPTLKRISEEFKSSGFGAGTFDTEEYRMIFIEAGELAVLVTIIDLYASLDDVFPYAYIMAEKIARVLDGRIVSPIIPHLGKTQLILSENKNTLQKISPEGEFIYKLVLGGDGGVGKTTLVHTFVGGKFEVDYKPTIGANILRKDCTLDNINTSVRFMIYDLAGQGQFARVRQSYLSSAKAGFLVFDVTRPQTFESINKWYEEFFKGAGEKISLILIGNKTDLGRVVTTDEGENLAKELKIPYIETSALNKDLVDEVFHMIAFKLVQDKLQYI